MELLNENRSTLDVIRKYTIKRDNTGKYISAIPLAGIENKSDQRLDDPPQKKIKLDDPSVCFFNIYKSAKEYKFRDIGFGELIYKNAYTEYESTKIKNGKPHPYVVVESRSLASEESPPIKYNLKLSSKIIDNGILSKVQLEAVIYACQRHEDILPDGRRAGFLIGDGAGVGKGRTAAGIIHENLLSGRNKAIWLSVSNDLREDAERDLRDIGGEINVNVNVRSLNKMSYSKIESKENGNFNEGVLFVTYSSLTSGCKTNIKNNFQTRFDQIVDWFGTDYDGVIILDECHKAKNLSRSNTTKTGIMIEKLQNVLKVARIVYASATGASEPKHLAYMVRLGLWGTGLPFEKFDDFEMTLKKRGVSAMELFAMEMKRKGMYIARQLSFEEVQYEIQETRFVDSTINGYAFKEVYNKCVKLWIKVHTEFKEAFERNQTEMERKDNLFELHFWSAHQRFFKYLCISAKVKECVKRAKEEMRKGKCIVIGLQTTGESSIEDSLCGESYQFASNAKSVLKNLIENHFPSLTNLERIQGEKKSIFKPEVRKKASKFLDSESEGSPSFTCSDSEDEHHNDVKSNKFSRLERFEDEDETENEDDDDTYPQDYLIQQKLLKDVEEMNDMFPINVLDQLIQDFGGRENVAEMTGRKGRIIEIDGRVSYEFRRDQINLLEKEKFNNGEKLVAIISDAASTGISLHSDKRCANQKQRFHITLELPWSAEKAIQQFGRTHRSNQVIPPHYLFLTSDLPGERRFAATVAKRLESLGALTHGDRRCADTRVLSQFNLDNEFGAKAVKTLINTILFNSKQTVPYPFGCVKRFEKTAMKALRAVGLSDTNITVTKFLNRILGIELDIQNGLFQYFLDIIEYESRKARLCNEFDHGIRDIMNDCGDISKDKTEIIRLNANRDCIKAHKVTHLFKGVSWTSAEKIYLQNVNENMFCESKKSPVKLLALAEQVGEDEFKLITPNFPEKMIDRESLHDMYAKLDYGKAKSVWDFLYNESENKCLHVICQQPCFFKEYCTFGKRKKTHYIMTGEIFYAWQRFSEYYPGLRMEIVRVQLHDRSKLSGALISPRYYKRFKDVFRDICYYNI